MTVSAPEDKDASNDVTPKSAVPPKKPPRAKERTLNKEKEPEKSITEQSEPACTKTPSKPETPGKPVRTPQTSKPNITEHAPDKEGADDSNETTNITSDSSQKKPVAIPRRVSGSTNKGSNEGLLQELKGQEPPLVNQEDKPSVKTESKVEKPPPPSITPRKPSIGQVKKQELKKTDEKADTGSKTDQEKDFKLQPSSATDKPAVTPRKPSVDRKKLEPKDLVSESQKNEDKREQTSLNSSEESSTNKNGVDSKSTEKKDTTTKPVVGSIKSRLAMFENR